MAMLIIDTVFNKIANDIVDNIVDGIVNKTVNDNSDGDCNGISVVSDDVTEQKYLLQYNKY
ncbi:23785_t:CDS:2, partial [Gigaspora margarita]